MIADRELDLLLVERVCANDPAAIEELFFDICGSMIGGIARDFSFEPEDLLGDLYVHLSADNWRRLRTWRGESSIKAWMRQVALNYCMRQVQDRNHVQSLSDSDEADGSVDPILSELEDEIDRVVDRVVLLQSIERVNNARYRYVLYQILDGKDNAQIASELGTTIDQGYVLRSRSIAALRRVWED